jgi:phosphoglucomutase
MKNKLYHFLPVGGILILLSAASGYAQTAVALKATIPFGFKVLDETFPAGNYTISFAREESRGVIWIRNQDTSAATNVLTLGHGETRMQNSPYLVFNRYGDQYFLTQVWTADSDVARVLAKSRSEREIQGSAPGKLAHQVTTAEKVLIAGR